MAVADFHHQPVLLDECVAHLDLQSGQTIVDGTVGGGGHAEAILDRTRPDGLLIGLDVDAEALEAARRRLADHSERIRLVHASFRLLTDVVRELGTPRVDGVLLDLGVSSPQLDRPERGFRFATDTAGDTPLDMRMDTSQGRSAADLLAESSDSELERWFREYGELRGARRLARTIVELRRSAPLRTTRDLLQAVERAGVGRGRRHNPATLVFQALRIAVNDELGALEEGLSAAIELLRPGGRLVVIAYHSLEDRIVKNRLRDAERGCVCPPSIPICVCGRNPTLERITRKPLRPGAEEIAANPRARSARLRAARRIEEAA